MTGSQLAFDLPPLQSWDEADFVITPQNERAFRLVTSWPEWEFPVAIIFGPPQSGKTHLAKIWQTRSGAAFLETSKLATHVWPAPYTPLVIEDAGTAGFCETSLFHHINLAREHKSSILLTAQTPPGQWNLTLPDLRSRVRSFPAMGIEPPADEHLAALLVKHFSDRQIEVAPGVISYLVARMERSMAAAQRVTAHIDRLSLSEHRKVTRALAARVFSELNGDEQSGNNDDGEVL